MIASCSTSSQLVLSSSLFSSRNSHKVNFTCHKVNVRENFSKKLQVQASSLAAVDTFPADFTLPGEDEFYEVPVHTVTVHDRLSGKTYKFDVPEVKCFFIIPTSDSTLLNHLNFFVGPIHPSYR